MLTPEQVHEGQAALQTPTEVVEDAIPARWRRNRGPTNAKQRQEAEQQAYIADMKALFAEVDALELAVETPTPPGKLIARQQRGGGWQTSDKPRAMSFGLSRRSAVAIPRLSILSTTSKASPSPLRISSMGPRASLHTLEEIPEFNLDGAATSSNRRRSAVSATIANPPPPRRSSVLTAGESRRSSAARMFNSLSLRISDALGKMSSRRSSVQGFREETEQGLHAVEEGEEEEEENDKKEIIATVRPRKAADIFSIEEDERTSNTSKALSVRSTASAGTILAKELDARLTLSGDEVREEVVESSPQFSELAPLEQLLRLCGQEVSTGIALIIYLFLAQLCLPNLYVCFSIFQHCCRLNWRACLPWMNSSAVTSTLLKSKRSVKVHLVKLSKPETLFSKSSLWKVACSLMGKRKNELKKFLRRWLSRSHYPAFVNLIEMILMIL